MKRPNCKQSKDNNPNWGKKIDLPEVNRTESSGVICFMDERDKLSGRYFDSRLECAGEMVSYSCVIE